MSTKLRTSQLIDNCTPSIQYDRQVQSACTAFDNQCYEIIDDTGQVLFIPSILGLPEPGTTDVDTETLLDILAWQFHVDFYDKTKPFDFRKQLVQMSIQWHMTKGTVALVQWVLDTYFPQQCTLQEWFDYRGPPGSPLWPPNYPIDNIDVQKATFGPSNVDIVNDRLNITGHGLTLNQQVRFVGVGSGGGTGSGPSPGPPSMGGLLPTPIVSGIYYYVANPQPNSFQLSPTQWSGGASGPGISGAVINLTDTGTGTANQVWQRGGGGSWHDRYRFRVLIDSHFIDPDDQKTVLKLIDRYKPISRWMEGFVRQQAMECDIGWCGMLLRFIYRTINAPIMGGGSGPQPTEEN